MSVDKYVGFVNTGSGDALPIGSTLYGTCDTAASTATKVVTCAAFDRLNTGVTIHVKFMNGNTVASTKLNVNNTGAVSVYTNGGNVGAWNSGSVVSFTYDGNYWIQNDSYDVDTKVTQDKTTNNATYPILLTNTIDKSSSGTDTARFCADTKINPSNGYLVVGKISTDGTNYYEIGAAAEKALGAVSSGSTGLVTGDDVYQALQSYTPAISGALVYKGTVSAANDLLNVALTEGWVYIADTAFTITDSSSIVHGVEVGDMIIVNDDGTYTTQAQLWAKIDLIQTNMDRLTDTDIDNAIAAAEAA